MVSMRPLQRPAIAASAVTYWACGADEAAVSAPGQHGRSLRAVLWLSVRRPFADTRAANHAQTQRDQRSDRHLRSPRTRKLPRIEESAERRAKAKLFPTSPRPNDWSAAQQPRAATPPAYRIVEQTSRRWARVAAASAPLLIASLRRVAPRHSDEDSGQPNRRPLPRRYASSGWPPRAARPRRTG